ncbi:MAG: hypothetical protein RBR71_10760 [Gudongella sp.]|nr:hypothetical protein [Gudongella sp.]
MDSIESLILTQMKNTISNFENKKDVSSRWKEPILGFADSTDPIFEQLKEVAFEEHLTPFDILGSAKTVIAYFLPFADFIWKSNINGRTSSIEWAKAYLETNILISEINDSLIEWFISNGYKAAKLPPEKNMDYQKLKSVWSNRHIAYIAGVGKFGLNNMIITEKGCCGRLGNIVTSFKIEPTKRSENESCLYKHDKSCGICVDRCVNNALLIDKFDRFRCYEMCQENEKIYKRLGEAEICGKCLVGLPCSSINPVF